MSKTQIPSIRFRGFDDAWEQRKVGEVSESYSGGTPSVGVKEYYGGQIPFIRSAEINSEITELFLTEEGLKNSSARLVAVGDILYALYGATSGEVGRARLKGAINQAILAIKPHTDYDSEYLAQWLRKSKHSIIETYLQGGQGNLSGTIVKELSVDFPSLKEQKAIGDFFRHLDNLITLHQRKFEKLTNVKKSMLEKMFPQNGSCYPAVRFKKFTDPWEQWKVSDVITDIARPIELMDNQRYQMVTVKRRNEGVVSRGFMYGRDILVKNYYEVHTDDYLISKRQLVHGANGLVPESLNNAVVSNEYMVCIGNEFVSAGFLALLSKTKSLKRDFFLSSYGVDIEKLVFDVDDWKKRLIVLPTIDEQNKICAYFRCLDNLITLHQRELEKLQSIKKFLLEKMFV